jgi:autotransporter passenger strand-loop-strand repeat protein
MSIQIIASGSSISGSSVMSGDTLEIASGGTMIGMTIDSGGSATIAYGGIDSGSTILAGGFETLSGTAAGDAVFGTQLISFGSAVANGETVYSGGVIDLFLKGGVVEDTTIMNGGTLAIDGNAIASNTTLGSGALLDLQSPKTNLEGTLTLDGPATIQYDVVASAGYGDFAVIAGFGSGSVIDEHAIGAGATLSTVISGGSTVATITSAGTTETLLFAGSVTSLGLVADGTGGVEIVYGSGGSTIASTGNVVTVSSGQTSSGQIVSSGGSLNVAAGGTVQSTTILSGGTAFNAGVDSATVISAGGYDGVSGYAQNDEVYGTLFASAAAALLTSNTVHAGGSIDLFLKGVVADATTVDSGGTLAISGNATAEVTTVSGGGIVTLESAKSVLSGSLTFVSGGTLDFAAVASAGYGDQAILSGFGVGSIIDEAAIASGATLGTTTSNGYTSATITSGGVSETLTFSGSIASNLALNPDGTGGVELTYVPCFARGTRVMTERGEVAVEALSIGDHVVTLDGAAVPVVWIGYRTVDCARHPNPEAVMPVRIQAHAFGRNRPGRDLLLSPDHAIFAEDVLIPVKHLVNGGTIRQLGVSTITYYHVELPRHAVIRAEGLPAESYLDSGDRGSFASRDGTEAVHPVWGGETRDRQLLWDACGAAPLCVTGPALDRVRAILAAQGAVLDSEPATLMAG